MGSNALPMVDDLEIQAIPNHGVDSTKEYNSCASLMNAEIGNLQP